MARRSVVAIVRIQIPARVGESNQRWRSVNGLPPKRLDGRD